MNEFYITNRDLITNFSLNTGTTAVPVWTKLCSTSELTLNQSFETKSWSVFCDALTRSINTGVEMTLEGTIKIDANNTAITNVLGKVHTLLSSGTISQFNNLQVKFDLLTNVNNSVLTYTTYICNVRLSLEGIGGSAEDEGSFDFTMTINGKGTVSA